MATAKKTTKKTTKKAPVKKVVHKKTTVRRKKPAALKTFVLQREQSPFMTFKITEQTIYWLLLLGLILILGIWVLTIQVNLSNILNQIQYTITLQ